MSGWRHAFSLSAEEVAHSEPPGTTRLMEHDLHRTVSGNNQVGEDHIQLVPTPSRSPADPLNWKPLRKYGVLATMALYAFTADFCAGLVAPALPILAFQILPPRSLADLSKLVSINVLLFGLANLIWVPLANIFGRRPILLISMFIFTFASMWCGLATTFESLLAARAIQGLAGGTSYTLAPDIIGEVFFVHERGRAMAIYTAFLALGPFVGGISGAYIAANLGYRYLFWISTALAGGTFICEALFVPETLFDRAEQIRLASQVTVIHEKAVDEQVEIQGEDYAADRNSGNPPTLLRRLGFGVYRGEWRRHFAAPWLSLAFPGTWMVMLQYGALVGGVVASATIGPVFLAAPPYLWGSNVGLINLGAIVGVALGAVLAFCTTDFLVKSRAKKELHGLTEPEIRLPILFPGVFLAVTGLWTFGFCAAHPQPGAWAGLVVGVGMLSAGLTIVPSVGFNYILEAYLPISTDCFVMTSALRAVVGFAWTYFIVAWVEEDGAALPFGIFGMLMAVFGLLAVPMWLFGKRTRIATARYLPKHSNH